MVVILVSETFQGEELVIYSSSLLPQAVRFGFSGFGDLLSIHQMSCAPVTLNESPGPSDIHCVPGISEPIVLELDPRLVTGRLAVALYNHAVQSSKTRITLLYTFI